jgi:hypothetical protein
LVLSTTSVRSKARRSLMDLAIAAPRQCNVDGFAKFRGTSWGNSRAGPRWGDSQGWLDGLQRTRGPMGLDLTSSASNSTVANRNPAFRLLRYNRRPFSFRMRYQAWHSARFLWANAICNRKSLCGCHHWESPQGSVIDATRVSSLSTWVWRMHDKDGNSVHSARLTKVRRAR